MSCHLLFSSTTPPLNTPTHSKISIFPITSTKQCTNFNNNNNNNNNNTRETRGAPISVNYPSIIPNQLPSSFNVDYLKSEFECEGVSFKDLAIGQSYVMKMVLENGSAASVVLPAGLITSYKPKMWHGTSVEVLHTNVSQDQAGTPVILGGVSLLLEVFADDDFSWRPQHWLLNAVQGSSQDSIQVEMVSRDVSGMVEAKHILSLQDDTLTSEISISNLKCSQVKIRGSIISHLNVSTPEATYAFGLEGSDFSDREPLNSNFCIIPPEIQKSKQQQQTGSGQLWPFKDLFSAKNEETDEIIMEGEEDENYKHLSSKMSRIYTYAPRNFTIIDRGKRNSVSVGRKGFEEVYLYSPGSTHESYGKYSYICVGSSALLKPLTLAPQQIWTGKQILHNPNL